MSVLQRLLCCALMASWAAHASAQDAGAFGGSGESDLELSAGADAKSEAAAGVENEPAESVEPARGAVQPSPQAAPSQSAPAAEDDPTEAAADDNPRPVEVVARVGGGFGTRSLELPSEVGVQRLDTTLFPAFDVGLSLTPELWRSQAQRFALGLQVHYQSSIGMRLEERPLFALPYDVSARASRLELSVVPSFAFGHVLSLALPLGASVRTFWPEVHDLPTPGYSLLGPHARLMLQLELGSSLQFRVGPEAQLIVELDDRVRELGVSGEGLSLGVQAELAWQLLPRLGVLLAYRESHARVPGERSGPALRDVERFATLSLTGRL